MNQINGFDQPLSSSAPRENVSSPPQPAPMEPTTTPVTSSSRPAPHPTPEECKRVFGPLPFLAVLTDEDLEALAPIINQRCFVAGETLFFEDDPSDAVYFVAEGIVEVFKSDINGQKLPLVTLRGYGVLGEMGLLNAAPRTASARAITGGRVLSISIAEFQAALASGMLPAYHLVLGFARVLSQRLSAMDEKLFLLFNHDTPQEGAHFHDIDELRHRLMTSWIV